ncbi:MAG: type II toxin-antitoxin system RelE/ParE family toxin [SAR324 cluster bacterium]|nr:type II toxin-antitoxin system RelE/ParE family toxin [SAR324 cluster bacterium]
MDTYSKLQVSFFRTDSGREPVREWLKDLDAETKKTIGEDIKTVQYGWPLGMPLVRKLDTNLWEIRIHLRQRIARILFTVVGDILVILHGFIKKSQKTPSGDIKLAKDRIRNLRVKK